MLEEGLELTNPQIVRTDQLRRALRARLSNEGTDCDKSCRREAYQVESRGFNDVPGSPAQEISLDLIFGIPGNLIGFFSMIKLDFRTLHCNFWHTGRLACTLSNGLVPKTQGAQSAKVANLNGCRIYLINFIQMRNLYAPFRVAGSRRQRQTLMSRI